MAADGVTSGRVDRDPRGEGVVARRGGRRYGCLRGRCDVCCGDTLDSGPSRSATFSIGTAASWQIQYTCTTAADFDSGFFIFDVHNGNGTGADMSGPLGPTSCPKGTSKGTVTVPETPNGTPQSRYLEVTAHGVTWTLIVIA